MVGRECTTPEEFDITSSEECRQAFLSLGFTGFGEWVDSKDTIPKGCSIQRDTNQMIWNTWPAGATYVQSRQDLRPVCKSFGVPTPPEPTPTPVAMRTIVSDNEWAYFLAFQESRKVGFSCPCGDLNWGPDFCNEIEGPGLHFHAPVPGLPE